MKSGGRSSAVSLAPHFSHHSHFSFLAIFGVLASPNAAHHFFHFFHFFHFSFLRPRTGLQHAASSRRAPLVQAARAVPLRTRGERGGAVAVPSANIRCPRRGVPSVALQWRRVRFISSSKEMKLTDTFRFHSLQWFPFVFRFPLRGMVFTRGGADWKESIGSTPSGKRATGDTRHRTGARRASAGAGSSPANKKGVGRGQATPNASCATNSRPRSTIWARSPCSCRAPRRGRPASGRLPWW